MGRKINFREQIQSFLIVCEGEKTEPLYFQAFRVPGKVKGTGKNTVSLVQEAIKLCEKGEYDQVWCVFDIEDYHPEQVNAAIRLAEQNGIRIAYSNQMFELWYLLHYHYYNTAIDRKEYLSKLSEQLGIDYQKNAHGLYMHLLSRQNTALANAKRLLAQYQPHDPCRDDPCTTVFELVEELNKFTPDSRK